MERTNTKNIYIMISQTPTKFARCLRKVGGLRYNHAAVGLDETLDRFYAYARPQHHGVFLAKLVRESIDSYTLQKPGAVPITVFRIPVSEEEYQWVENTIRQMQNDPEYMYNLLSVISYPLTKGFATYKAYTCIEFATYILKGLNYPLPDPCCSYKPDDLLPLLQEQRIYQGDIREYVSFPRRDQNFFAPLTLKQILYSFKAFCIIAHRSVGVFRHRFS